jgi:hypothetical protein
MKVLLRVLLWLANSCWWVIYRSTPDVTIMRVRIDFFVGEPDELGSYEVTTFSKDYGPKKVTA